MMMMMMMSTTFRSTVCPHMQRNDNKAQLELELELELDDADDAAADNAVSRRCLTGRAIFCCVWFSVFFWGC